MRVFKVDLYEYFGVEKPNGGKADLTCYLRDNSVEVDPNRKNPAMLVIPGGGYGFVSAREGEPVAISFLTKGFSSFVLEYSIAPVSFPYQLVEAVMAMNYIKLNATELLVDENAIAAVGFSAGGHLCAMLGSIPDHKAVETVFESKVDARPNAVILSYPVITFVGDGCVMSFENLCAKDESLIAELDIQKLVNEKSAPAFIWATYTDGCVLIKNSIAVADAYERAGVPFSIHIWGKGVHGLSVADKNVYGKATGGYDCITTASNSVNKWVDLASEWLEEIGVGIK